MLRVRRACVLGPAEDAAFACTSGVGSGGAAASELLAAAARVPWPCAITFALPAACLVAPPLDVGARAAAGRVAFCCFDGVDRRGALTAAGVIDRPRLAVVICTP